MGIAKIVHFDVALIFRQQNLAKEHELLARGCHLYIVSRRPRTYIDPESVRLDPGGIRGQVIIEASHGKDYRDFEAPFSLVADEELKWDAGTLTDYYRIVGGSTGTRYVHGDTWAFALFASYSPDLAAQEVLYVGQAFGKEGERSSLDRVLEHKTIQKIYADHQSAGFDIFISFLRLADGASILQIGSSASAEAYKASVTAAERADINSVFKSLRRRADMQREQITLSEAAFISYFKPSYNIQHKKNFPGRRSSLALNLDAQGYTNLSVSLDDGGSGVQFWSEERRESRYHRFSCFLPSANEASLRDLSITAEEAESGLLAISDRIALDIRDSPITLALLTGDLPERFNRI
jgi:hypothetical protein